MVFTIPSCMGQALIISHSFSFILFVEIRGYLYRGIGRTYVSLPGKAGGLPKLITVKRLCELIHISERQCHRLFLKETKMTPAQYVEKYRMQMASELLATTEKEIKAIALVVGFATYTGFVRAFERNFSVTPTAYRKAFSLKN